ncbi:lipase family alpha/beta hydrolase [Bifidobacterium saguinibicoloris]|uniref:lipase family alpha/beta hydrolase n=1 Tax=Bifidobacterium saguinibicoloris TaxID=2834433 RepID=UPI001C575F58|nr:alpha/beta hydrolase [Bifidobacterium saguinibicoloris]MBW3080631.1 alpha/beta hydrolase [Bifidobacterium saguinibicoloris]
MNWQVTSQIHGGHQSSPATMEEYRTLAAALDDAGGKLIAQAQAWSQAALDLGSERYSVPLCTTLQTGIPHTAPADHATLPYVRLIAACQRRAKEMSDSGWKLKGMADLVTRAQSLYAEAERTVRRGITELTQAGTQLRPGWATYIMGALAVGGLVGSWVHEGAPNLATSSWATAPFQQGYLSGIGSMIAGVEIGKGVVHTDEVNQAAEKIGRFSAPLKNLLQGVELHLTRVEANAPVVRESRSVSESLENLRRLGEERLGKIDLDSGLTYATIAVQRYEKADGTNAWLVTIPGTDGFFDSPFGWEQNVELMSDDAERRTRADSARMVVEAMERAGIGRDEPVAIVGHSQGGIVAAAIASDQSERFDIRHVVTAGSPIANHPIPSKTWVTAIEIKDELVASLDGADNPATEQWMTIQGTVMPADDPVYPTLNDDGSCTPATGTNVRGLSPYAGTPVADPKETQELSHWLKYHQAAYRNASDLGSPAVVAHEEHFADVIAGELKETQYYEGRMRMWGDYGPKERITTVTSGQTAPSSP